MTTYLHFVLHFRFRFLFAFCFFVCLFVFFNLSFFLRFLFLTLRVLFFLIVYVLFFICVSFFFCLRFFFFIYVSFFFLFAFSFFVCLSLLGHRSLGSQSFWLLLFYYLNEPFKLLIPVTCFTLCSIKSWCTAAVESVHSVCTGPVVLTGMTCTFINLCFRR